ncbi:hypothetical protein G7054_g10083 [Neopestalotiopsis clavispora]|nr:hypothetical protein G7054_g10083 [Neopestalotiopsis clavispora]
MSESSAAMANKPAPTVDIFYLTFNAGKAFISSQVFGKHVYNAFKESSIGSTYLPELVALSLQELAPIADAFRGGYWLNPYLSCYEAAINHATAKYIADESCRDNRNGNVSHAPPKPYTLIKSCNVGMTGLMLFAQDPNAVSNIKMAETGFGAGDMANKGAVGLRVDYTKDGSTTELTFVSTHLAAMEWNLERRNKNWATVVSTLVFADPKKIVAADESRHRSDGVFSEDQPLLFHADTEKKLHEISIYKPGSHLFVAGDLNYRISKTTPPENAVFPNLDPDSANHYSKFLVRDQLKEEQFRGNALHGLSEAPIEFPPTYKLNIEKKRSGSGSALSRFSRDVEDDDVEWSFATHRWPGWCDRVLYMDLPVSRRIAKPNENEIKVLKYNSMPPVRTSDHRAVYLRAHVPVLSPEELAPSSDSQYTTIGNVVDPRIQLPLAIEPEAWQHRLSIKKWEYTIGWSLAIAQSKQTILIVSTLLMLGLSSWYFRNRTAS